MLGDLSDEVLKLSFVTDSVLFRLRGCHQFSSI
jgi:hypothetical protein